MTLSLVFLLSRSQLRLWLPLSGGTDEAVSAAILARVLEERQEAGPQKKTSGISEPELQ